MQLGLLADHVCGKITAEMHYGELVGEKSLHQHCATGLSEVAASH